MDNLTHSLVGAVLGRMGLKRLTGRAMPALILSANLPDIDTGVGRLFGAERIEVHRGFTHGIGGLATLPFVAAALIFAWNRWRPSAQPVRFWPLVLVCLAGTLSHPLLDLMNTYGVRLLEPLSDGRFHADTLFIIDPFVWIALIVGLELSWRAERLGRPWHRPAIAMFALLCAYAAGNFALSTYAESLGKRELHARGITPTMVVAAPQPLEFWKRRMLWRNQQAYGSGWYDPLASIHIDPVARPTNLDDPRVAAARASDRQVRAFLFWSRMPIVTMIDGRAYLSDQRFIDRVRKPRDFAIPLDKAPASS